jgi:hypothetical protein
MRKVYKLKRHSCALCKPHKMGWAPRFKEKDRFLRSTTARCAPRVAREPDRNLIPPCAHLSFVS